METAHLGQTAKPGQTLPDGPASFRHRAPTGALLRGPAAAAAGQRPASRPGTGANPGRNPGSAPRVPGQAAQPRTEKPHRWDRSPPPSSTPLPPTGTGLRTGGGVEAVQPNDGPGLALGPASRPGTGTFPAQTTPGHPKYPEKHPYPSSGNLGRFSGTRTQMMPPVLPARPVARGNANTAEGYRAAPCWLTTIPTRTTPTSPLKGWTPTTCRPSRTHSYSGYIPNPADAE